MKTIITGWRQQQHIIPTLSGGRKNTFTALIVCVILFSPFFWRGAGGEASANNLRISNITYAAGAPATINFDIAWDNSWYATTGVSNYDAVWVFIKWQTCATTDGVSPSPVWNVAPLTTVSANHVVTDPLLNLPITIDAVADGMGVFIHQTTSQIASSISHNVTLRFNVAYGAVTYNWKVFGIEMAYIPTAAYSLGDNGGTVTNPFGAGTPVAIASDAAIGAGALYAGSPAVPLAYPAGYTGFYCMKEEISQGQYKDFLNTLNYDQQVNRTSILPNTSTQYAWALPPVPTGGPYNRNGIKMNTLNNGTNGVYNYTPAVYGCDLNNNNNMGTAAANYNGQADDGPNVACNYLKWGDICAFLDWAALRPMTEMEYEKVCRGTVASVADEYPWGTSTDLTAALSSSINNGGTTAEVSTLYNLGTSVGLCVYNNSLADANGPIRGGSSPSSSTDRVHAAAAYYGILDMAGNVWEQVVSVNTPGVNFTGSLGNGVLTTGTTGYAGNATNTDWPGIDATPANGVTGANGSGARGGSWYTQDATNRNYLCTSDRSMATTPSATRNMDYGGRGVR